MEPNRLVEDGFCCLLPGSQAFRRLNGCPRIPVNTKASEDAAEKLVRMSARLRSFTMATAARESGTVTMPAGVFVRRMVLSASS